jgi:uncharacterized protein YozE (UPF0346 family)
MDALEGKIDRYLSGSMTGMELISFEKEIFVNKDLQSQIALKKDLHHFFKSRNPELNESLNQLGQEYFSDKTLEKGNLNKKKFTIIATILISITGLIVYYFNTNTQQNIEKVQVEETTILPEPLEESEVIELPILEEEATEEKIEIPTFKPQKPINQPSNNDNQPIASVENYNKNPVLESLIRENIRSAEIEYLHESPVKGAVYKLNGLKSMNLKITAKVNDSEIVELLVYNNEIDKFNKDIKLLITEIQPIKLSNNQFQLKFNANVSLEKGLYYYLMRTKKSKQILHVSKFIVQ